MAPIWRPAFPPNARRGRFRAGSVAIGAEHAGAKRSTRFGRRFSDAGGRTQHNGGLPGEIEQLR
jgi:hypothetical protein